MPHIRIQDKNFESIFTHTMLTARFCSSLFTCPQFVLVITHHPYSHYTDLAKPKSRAHIFFPHTSQGHNALPMPGLEPRSSDSEPSALTTGLLNKAIALAYPQYSWPCMLKVAPSTVVWLYGHTSKFFWLDRLLLFCIIMGLHSASSATRKGDWYIKNIILLLQNFITETIHWTNHFWWLIKWNLISCHAFLYPDKIQ